MYFHMGDDGELHIGRDDDERVETVEQIIEEAANSADIDFVDLENEGAPVFLGNSYAEYQFRALVGPNREERAFGIGERELDELNREGQLSVRAYKAEDRSEHEGGEESLEIQAEYPHPESFDRENPKYAAAGEESYFWKSLDGESYIRAVNHGEGQWSFESNIDGTEEINYGESFEEAYSSNFEANKITPNGDRAIANPSKDGRLYSDVDELKADIGIVKPGKERKEPAVQCRDQSRSRQNPPSQAGHGKAKDR